MVLLVTREISRYEIPLKIIIKNKFISFTII
jgi:hypothetical protein